MHQTHAHSEQTFRTVHHGEQSKCMHIVHACINYIHNEWFVQRKTVSKVNSNLNFYTIDSTDAPNAKTRGNRTIARVFSLTLNRKQADACGASVIELLGSSISVYARLHFSEIGQRCSAFVSMAISVSQQSFRLNFHLLILKFVPLLAELHCISD